MMRTAIKYCLQPTSILPLVVFRVAFGVLMFFSTLRFIANGWVNTFYIQPTYHFTFLGFEWIKPLPGWGMWAVFLALLLLSVTIGMGFLYRASISLFFVLFTYVELLDKAYYLNHYYFISVLSFLLIFLPMHRALSVDVWLRPSLRVAFVPRWTIASLQFLLGIVYCYAGLAKLQSDWLMQAQPLRIWLRANADIPLIGGVFTQVWFAYLMSWAGALYDLTIPFALVWRRTRGWAYGAVVGFHLVTAGLFNIGVFPYVMIVATVIFFDVEDYRTLAKFLRIGRLVRWLEALPSNPPVVFSPPNRMIGTLLVAFFAFQLLFPWRFVLYGGNILWTQEGFRFGWRVMLAENTGYAIFHVRDVATNKTWEIDPSEQLTRTQIQQMSFQPDMILQFAHFLHDEYAKRGFTVEVRAEVYASVNGRPSQLLIDPTVNLANEPIDIWKKSWILPLE